ncbi:PREDICTED: photosynthetic NDH subunit of subcomplex B 4, chloroplastic isoform X1 [Lupinus angustifolius]|uniref:photosynthetic NDH subunit of subcomplex B 4, chloroplastic isoform X1 n=1 Tax=Lupinus angustifolius TaxID=3871 RepID=UPI00092ECB76|nr:PREDICTED: photosynthetic NDH subunit of subcomplex B 4, chloroplastic isoform X1 [Lupinus angustifolius]
MAEAIMGFTVFKSHIHNSSCLHARRSEVKQSSRLPNQHSTSTLFNESHKVKEGKFKRASLCKVNGLPDWPLMAVIVEQMEGQRDMVTIKSVWHLSDEAIKNVYSWYIMFTVWGCLFYGSMKDPYYDSETYRGDGGDGTGNWIYEKQEAMEAEAREALWREELIEEIELKVGGLKELEEAGKKEELVK